jgi:hypothetical protein
LEHGAAKLDPSYGSASAPRPTVDTVTALLKGLPLIHQEILLLKLAGYSDRSLEKLLRVTPAVAQKSLERLKVDYSIVLHRDQDGGLWPASWSEVMRRAGAAKNEGCAPLRQLVRILDGQVSWYDKNQVERHMAGCLHCLECWTALREIHYWRREAKPCLPAELELLLSCLPLQSPGRAGKSFRQGMLS